MIIMDTYILDDLKNYAIDHLLYRSGNKVVDDLISYTPINNSLEAKILEFVPYNQFKYIKFIAEGGFSKVYKAIWIDGNIRGWNKKEINFKRSGPVKVVLKKLNNSENITSKDINEVGIH